MTARNSLFARFARSAASRAERSAASARLRAVTSWNVSTVPATVPCSTTGVIVYSTGNDVPSFRQNTSSSTRHARPSNRARRSGHSSGGYGRPSACEWWIIACWSWPISSAALQPSSRSAAGFTNVVSPCASVPSTPSPAAASRRAICRSTTWTAVRAPDRVSDSSTTAAARSCSVSTSRSVHVRGWTSTTQSVPMTAAGVSPVAATVSGTERKPTMPASRVAA